MTSSVEPEGPPSPTPSLPDPKFRCFECGGTNRPGGLLVVHTRGCHTDDPDVRSLAASRPDVAPRCPEMADGVCTRYADGANWCEPGECPVAPLDGLADALLVAALDDLGGTLDRLEAMPSDPFYERSPEAEWTQDDAAPSYVETADVAPQEDG